MSPELPLSGAPYVRETYSHIKMDNPVPKIGCLSERRNLSLAILTLGTVTCGFGKVTRDDVSDRTFCCATSSDRLRWADGDRWWQTPLVQKKGRAMGVQSDLGRDQMTPCPAQTKEGRLVKQGLYRPRNTLTLVV